MSLKSRIFWSAATLVLLVWSLALIGDPVKVLFAIGCGFCAGRLLHG